MSEKIYTDEDKRDFLNKLIELGCEPWLGRADWKTVSNDNPDKTPQGWRNFYRRLVADLLTRASKEETNPLAMLNELQAEPPKKKMSADSVGELVMSVDFPASPDEILDAVGLDENEWSVGRMNVTLGQNSGKPTGRTTVYLKPANKTEAVEQANMVGEMIASLTHTPIPLPRKEAPKFFKAGMWMPIIFDAHLEKKVDRHAQPEKVYLETLSALLSRAFGASGGEFADKIVLTVGQDFGHFDTWGFTTTKGTLMDVTDISYSESVALRSKTAIAAVMMCSAYARKVDVVIMPGNHDMATSFWLGAVLEAAFDTQIGRELISVSYNNEDPRLYLSYGNNLIGLTHGDGISHFDLPILMATEAAHLWGPNQNRIFLTGHTHTRKAMEVKHAEFKGVLVKTVSSLRGADVWHKKHGYVCNVTGGSLLAFDKNTLVGEFYADS